MSLIKVIERDLEINILNLQKESGPLMFPEDNISVRCTLETSGSNRFATNIAVLRTLEYKIVPQLIQMSGFNSSAPQ
jgi:hypothetical protein